MLSLDPFPAGYGIGHGPYVYGHSAMVSLGNGNINVKAGDCSPAVLTSATTKKNALLIESIKVIMILIRNICAAPISKQTFTKRIRQMFYLS